MTWTENQPGTSVLNVEGSLVEISGLEINVFDLSGWAAETDGSTHNGKRGLAQPSEDGVHEVVRTLDGFSLLVPAINLRPCTQAVPQAALAGLNDRGYCVLQMYQMCQTEEHRQDVAAHLAHRSDFTQPRPEFEEAYMGRGPGGELVWLPEDADSIADEILRQHAQCISDACASLGTWAEDGFGFRSPLTVAEPMLRRWQGGSPQKKLESIAPPDKMTTEAFLDFIQRRKLCFMLVVDGAGTVDLSPKSGDSYAAARLPVRPGMLLVFRHDHFFYTYKPSGNDVLLQAWLLEQPQDVRPEVLRGSKEEILTIVGASGVEMPSSNRTHVMSVSARFSGDSNSYEQTVCMYTNCTDCGVVVPLGRWDNAPYYEFIADGSYGQTPGKSAVNHSSFLQPAQLEFFNNQFFGFTEEEADSLGWSARSSVEESYNCLHRRGFTLESLRGEKILIYASCCRRELEFVDFSPFHGQKYGGTSWTEAQLCSHIFGTVGPTCQIDTACSASLVAINCAYDDMSISRDGRAHHHCGNHIQKALVGAMTYNGSVMVYIGLTAAHMLSSKGRSLSYDMSACGFAKGEGNKWALLEQEDSIDLSFDQMATFLGGCSNQDGRSASLTAPNGPSQSSAVRMSLRASGRDRKDVYVSETHGTGTALGDPIEVGSLRAVMFGRDISRPLLHGAGKSLTSHLEYGAGLAGFIKTVIQLNFSIGIPNCHLAELNSNIETEGYPALWQNEITNLGAEHAHGALSSFGFGGTNSRADLWASCSKGPHRVVPAIAVGSEAVARITEASQSTRFQPDLVPNLTLSCPLCGGNMHPLSKEAIQDPGIKHRVRAVRSEAAAYDCCSRCYRGGYMVSPMLADVGDPGRQIAIVGSWTNFSAYEEMQQTVDSYIHFVKLDESQVAQFYLVLDKDPQQVIHPGSSEADQHAGIIGPHGAGVANKWQIDGREAGVQPGAVYQVKFVWDYEIRQMSWAVVTPDMKRGLTKIERSLLDGLLGDAEGVNSDEETAASTASTADADTP